MKIACIVPYKIYPASMGGQKGVSYFYAYLSKIADVTMFTIKDNACGDVEFSGKMYSTISNSTFRYINPFLFFTIKKLLKDNQITHLVLDHPYFGWLGVLLKKTTNVKLIIKSHNIEAHRFKSVGKQWWKILYAYEKWTHLNANYNFFITDEDRIFAISNYKLDAAKCATITYGIGIEAAPSSVDKLSSRQTLLEKHNISPNSKILLFNGTLNYLPNRNAIDVILREINPRLIASKGYEYKILICGKGLNDYEKSLSEDSRRNIIFVGFVDDINLYFKGADVFINPVLDGGGIKTKVVESLGHSLNVVSATSGAIGIPKNIVATKLSVVDDNDWGRFVDEIIKVEVDNETPSEFFEYFYWGNIARKAKEKLFSIH